MSACWSGVPDVLVSSALVFRRSSVQVLPPAPPSPLLSIALPPPHPHCLRTFAIHLSHLAIHLSIIIILIAPGSLSYRHASPSVPPLSPSPSLPLYTSSSLYTIGLVLSSIHRPSSYRPLTYLLRTPSYDRAAPPMGRSFPTSLRPVPIHLFSDPVSIGPDRLFSCYRPVSSLFPYLLARRTETRSDPFPYLRPPYGPYAPDPFL